MTESKNRPHPSLEETGVGDVFMAGVFA